MVAKIETQLMLKSKTLKLILKILLKQDVKTIMQVIKSKPRLNAKCKPMSQPSDKQKSRQKFGLFWLTFICYI